GQGRRGCLVSLLTGPPPARHVALRSWSEATAVPGGDPLPPLPPNKIWVDVRDEDIPPGVRVLLTQDGDVSVLGPAAVRVWQQHLDGRYREHAGEYLT